MTLNQFLLVMRARWRAGLIALLLVVLGAVALSFVLPKRFASSASIMLDVRSPDPVAGMVMAGMMSPAYMATQVDLLSSERVMKRVIRGLKLNEASATRDQWLTATGGVGEFEAWLSELLVASLEVKPSRESNVINVTYNSADPNFSAAMSNAIVQAYIETSLELRADTAGQYSNFFDARAKKLREDLEIAQAKLSAYQKSKNIIATDERLDVENARLSELSTQLVVLQAAAAESSNRQAQVGARADQVAEVLNNSVVATLTAEIAREESRLKELGAKWGESHPQMVEARAHISELRSRMEAAVSRAGGSVAVNNNINQGRLVQLTGALERQRAKVLELKSLRDGAAVLQRDVENAQRSFDAMTSRATQSGVESQNTQSNISVIKRASAPSEASSPKLKKNLAIGLFLGTLAAVGLMLVRELLDRRIRTVTDITEELAQSLLVVLPVSKAAQLGKKDPSRVKLIKDRVLSGLPKPKPSI
jgi:polysaccharide biosynthesis transport protein